MEEFRLAEANGLAGAFAKNAKKGDGFKVILGDGNYDVWEFVYVGYFAAGTVIDASPVESSCT